MNADTDAICVVIARANTRPIGHARDDSLTACAVFGAGAVWTATTGCAAELAKLRVEGHRYWSRTCRWA